MIKHAPAQLKFSPSKWTMKPIGRMAMKRVLRRAESMIRQRVQRQNRDIYGRPLPRLKKGTDEWVFFGQNDPRFDVPPLVYRNVGAKKSGDRKVGGQIAMVERGGYPRLKERVGSRPIRDGELTGDMWASLSPTIYMSKKKGIKMKLRFTKSSITSEIDVEDKTRKKGMRTVRKRIDNRDKARLMQFESGNASKRQRFSLMALTTRENLILTDIVVESLRLLK